MMPMPKDSIAQPSDLAAAAPCRHADQADRRPAIADRQWRIFGRSQAGPRAACGVPAQFEQPHARIVRIDASQAQGGAGRVAVFTADDVAGDFKPVIPFSRMANYYATPILPLAAGKVRYVGEAVVAGDRRIPLSRRGRAGTDRDRIRAARRGLRS